MMTQGPEHILIYCTCPDTGTANSIAEALVAERLAACVNIVPGLVSCFHWQGKQEQAHELLLLIKTVRSSFPAVVSKIRSLHPYEVPEIIAVPIILGQHDYLAWIEQETG